ncbi:MAG: ABC transporter substrate-binding protein, partial [Desulfobacterales bacterium]|nr:ABC transporter substrate-binding protein [Desulfobacterales bacterium]
MRNILSILLFLLCILTVLGGCSPNDTTETDPAVQTLVIGTGRDTTRPGDFLPFGMWEPGALIYETLVNLDAHARPVPCLAKSWEISPDGLTYAFTLGENIRFHDGEPFNARAVVENYEKLGRVQWQVLAPLIRRVRALDEFRVVFELKRPFPLFFVHLATSSHGMVSPAALEPATSTASMGMVMGKEMKKSMPPAGMKSKAMGDAPMKKSGMDQGKMSSKAMGSSAPGVRFVVARAAGTGPYLWDEQAYNRGRSYQVTANGEYWQGKPRFEQIIWKIIPDANARAIALEAHEIHMTGLTPVGALGREHLERLKVSEYIALGQGSNWGARLLVLNPGRPPLDRPGVRQALQSALDLNSIQTLLGDTSRVCAGPLGPDTPYTLPDQGLPVHDPELARRLLDKEGVVDTNGDGIREYNGRPFTLEVVASKHPDLMVMVCSDLKAVGVDARLTPREGGAVFGLIQQRDYDLISHPNISSFYLDLYGGFHSRSWLPVSLGDDALDPLLEQARNCTDAAEFIALSHRIQKEILARHV